MTEAASTATPKISHPFGGVSRNVVISFAGQTVPLAVGVICMRPLAAALGPERLGLLSIMWVIVAYSAVLDLGITVASTRSVARALASAGQHRIPAIFWTGISAQLAMGIVGGVALAQATPALTSHVINVPPSLREEAQRAFYVCAAGLPLVLVSASIIGLLQAAQRFDLLLRSQLPASSAQYIIPLACAVAGAGLPVVVGMLLAIRACAACFMFANALRQFPNLISDAAFEKSELSSLLKFGSWVTVSTIVSPLLVYADRFLIANQLTLADVTYYTVPLDAAMRVLVFSSSMAAALFPALTAASAGVDFHRANTLMLRATKILLCLTGVPLAVVCVFANDVMRLWMGEPFASRSAPVLRIVLVGIVANAMARIPYTFLQAAGRPDVIAKLQLVALPAHFMACLILTKHCGIIGTAVTWTGRLSAELLLLFYFTRLTSHLSLKSLIATETSAIIVIIAILTAAGSALAFAVTHPIARAAAPGLLVLLGLSSSWMFGFKAGDRQSLIKRIVSFSR